MKDQIQIIQEELTAFVQEMEATKEHGGAIEMEVHIGQKDTDYICRVGNSVDTVSASGKTMQEAYWKAVVKYESQP